MSCKSEYTIRNFGEILVGNKAKVFHMIVVFQPFADLLLHWFVIYTPVKMSVFAAHSNSADQKNIMISF